MAPKHQAPRGTRDLLPEETARWAWAEAQAREQAKAVAASIAEQGGPRGLEGKQIVALVAYLQRLGTDIKKPPPAPAAPKSEPQARSEVPGAPGGEAVATKGVVP